MNDKRDTYRVETRRRFLVASVEVPDRPPVQGEVVDLSAKGIGVLFDLADAEALGPVDGTVVDVQLEALVLLRPIRAKAHALRRGEESGRVRYGFAFLDAEAVGRQVPFILQAQFNRRRSPRVRMDRPVEVKIEGPDGPPARGTMLDVSFHGMAVEIERKHRERVSGLDGLHASFTLPDGEREIHMVGRVTHRHSSRGELVLGFTFVREESDATALAEIEAFVSAHVPTTRNATTGRAEEQ